MTDQSLIPSSAHPFSISPCLLVSSSPSRPVIQRTLLALALAALTLTTGCKARKDYPEPNLGSHSPSFNVVFGRLVRVPAANPDAPPVWAVRFGNPNDAYQGELALTGASPSFIVGYSGGEPVELRGHVLDQPTSDAFSARWYYVDSIQLWTGYRQ